MTPTRHCSHRCTILILSWTMPLLSCSNSDSIGSLGHGGAAGSTSGAGGGHGGSSGTVPVAGSGGALGGGGSPGSGGMTGGTGAGGAGGGSGGTHTGFGGSGVGGQGTGGEGAGGQGTGGQATSDASADTRLDTAALGDGQDLAALCRSTGGQVASTQCCTSVGDFPSSCVLGACGCAPTSSHTVSTCTCPNGGCFSPTTGCGPRADGDAAMDGYQCPALTDVHCTYGYTVDAHGCQICAPAPDGGAVSVTFGGCGYIGDLNHVTIQERLDDRNLCISVQLAEPGTAPASLTLPTGWGLVGATASDCSVSSMVRATSVTGAVSWDGSSGSTGMPTSATINALVYFDGIDAGQLTSPIGFNATGIDLTGSCLF